MQPAREAGWPEFVAEIPQTGPVKFGENAGDILEAELRGEIEPETPRAVKMVATCDETLPELDPPDVGGMRRRAEPFELTLQPG